MTETHSLPTSSREEHLQQARSAAEVLAALVHKNGGSLEVALDDFLNEENSDLDAHYDEGRRLYRIEPRSVTDQT